MNPPTAGAPEISRLFDDYAPFVRDLARLLLGPTGDPDDVLQEVFVIAWRKLDVTRTCGVRTWLARVTVKVAAAARRRAWLRNRLGIDAAPDPADPQTPETALEVQEALRVFTDVASRLPEKKRTVLVLSDIHGFSGPEIAEAVGCRIETAYSRLLHARRDFVALLAQAGYGRSAAISADAVGPRSERGVRS